MKWLPSEFPPLVKIVLSVSSSGTYFEGIQKKNWPQLKVLKIKKIHWNFFKIENFTNDEKVKFTESYLSQYSKKLNKNQLNLIIESKSTSNPLYLKTLLEEVLFAY